MKNKTRTIVHWHRSSSPEERLEMFTREEWDIDKLTTEGEAGRTGVGEVPEREISDGERATRSAIRGQQRLARRCLGAPFPLGGEEGPAAEPT